MSEYCMVITTLNDEEDVRKITEAVLEENLAACVQTSIIGSHYVWKGEVCHEQEILVVFKTSWDFYSFLENKIKSLHPYETPEIIALDIKKGFIGYFDWIDEVTGKTPSF